MRPCRANHGEHSGNRGPQSVICTRCGHINQDRERSCTQCGHKLQSFFTVPDLAGKPVEDERLRLTFCRFDGRFMRKCMEAWVLVVVVGGAVAYGLLHGDWVALYAALPAAAVIAWLRKM